MPHILWELQLGGRAWNVAGCLITLRFLHGRREAIIGALQITCSGKSLAFLFALRYLQVLLSLDLGARSCRRVNCSGMSLAFLFALHRLQVQVGVCCLHAQR